MIHEATTTALKPERRVQWKFDAINAPAENSRRDPYESDECQQLEYEFNDFEDCHTAASAVASKPVSSRSSLAIVAAKTRSRSAILYAVYGHCIMFN